MPSTRQSSAHPAPSKTLDPGGVGITRRLFGQTAGSDECDAQDIWAFTLTNRAGVSATILTLGGTLQALCGPDRDGVIEDVVLGHESATGYVEGRNFLGVTVGRYANRIADGRFNLDGAVHVLDRNDGPNHLHGGDHGFDQRLWTVDDTQGGLTLSLISPDGDGGYPGELTVRARWTLDEDGALTVAFEATTTRPTVVNLTNHAFFNLAAARDTRSAVDHVLTLFADDFTPVNETMIPVGAVQSVDDTPFDFRRPMRIADRLDDPHEQLRLGRGYDHNFILRGERGVLRPAARLADPVSGRCLDVSTTEAGLQVYSGNFLDGSIIGKGGRPLRHRDGVCLEPQTFPDAPNQPGFPTARLNPGETYRHTLCFRLSVLD